MYDEDVKVKKGKSCENCGKQCKTKKTKCGYICNECIEEILCVEEEDE